MTRVPNEEIVNLARELLALGLSSSHVTELLISASKGCDIYVTIVPEILERRDEVEALAYPMKVRTPSEAVVDIDS